MTKHIQPMKTWKDINGFEGLYQVSSSGDVKRIAYNHKLTVNKKPKILKQFFLKGNYATVRLCKDGMLKTYYVHKLVAEAFIESPPHCPLCKTPFEINHIDTNSKNNHYKNLEYTTHKDNVKKAAIKTQKNSSKKLTDKDVIEIKRLVRDKVPYSKIATKFNISRGLVCSIMKQRSWKHIK